ncbi:MAG TPA: YbaK/EbsC family protein [Candidatus Methylomirabilis sp.]|nr:YbaK/EbsC family protein [Candidatus Methylomirabilis sp.]
MLKRFEEFLGAHAAQYERIVHAEAFTAQEEAAAAHVSGWSWAKVVIVKEREGFTMAVLPACCAIEMNRLKGAIGLGEIELASVEEMLRLFPGCELGAIPPFGRLFGMATFVEEGLLEQHDITMPAGDHRSAVRMRTAEYLRLAEPRRAQFAVHEGAIFPVHPKLSAPHRS